MPNNNNNTYIIYHKNCFDGFGSAFCAWLHFGESATYIPMGYGDPMPRLEDGSTVYVVDFSFKRPIMEELANRVKLQVLDHHASAEKDLVGLSYCHFDMSKSGALLTWEYFNKLSDRLMPYKKFIEYISDRDLNKNLLPGSMQVASALSSYPKDFDKWKVLGLNINILKTQGRTILRHINEMVGMMCDQATFTNKFKYVTLNGVVLDKVPIVNVSGYWYEIGIEMLKRFPEYPMISFYTNRKDYRQWSLRSRTQENDISEVAKLFGGGGHKQAAGFIEDLGINPLI